MDVRPRLTFFPRPCYACGEQTVARLRSQKCWNLLQLLAESSAWVERDDLATSLWPGAEAKSARQNLRQCLLYIRQGLPESKTWLLAEGDRMRLAPSEIDVDLGGNVEETPDSEPLVMPRLAAVFAHMDDEARRTAVAAMTPAWVTTGCHTEGLDEIEKLRRTDQGRTNAELILCQAELQNAAHHVWESVQSFEEFQRLPGPVPLDLQARYLVGRSHVLARLYQYEDSARYTILAYRAARSLQDRAIAVRALQLAATCLIELGNMDEARRAIGRALSLTENDLENPCRPFLFQILTRLELVTNNFEAAREASDLGIECVRVARSQPGVNGIVSARIGRMRESLGDHRGAKVLYHLSLEAMSETECVQEKAEIYTYLGDAHRTDREPEKSLDCHKKAVKLRRSLKTPDALATSLRGMGMAAQLLGDHYLAINCLSESALLYEGCGRGIGKASALIPLSRSYAALNRYEEALPMFETSLEVLGRELVGPSRMQLPLDLSAVEDMRVELDVMAGRRSSPESQVVHA